MKNTIIDLGNFNIKYNGEIKGVFSSKYHTNFEANEEGFNRVQYSDKKYYIGVGSYSLEYTKTNKDSLIPQVLYGVSKANGGNNITTNLCLLLPIEQMAQKEDLIELFQKKFFKSEVNGKQINIRIEKVVVLPECQVAKYSLDESMLTDDVLLVDLGSRTCNFAGYNFAGLVVNGTSKIGIINLYERVLAIENAKGNDYILEDIENQVNRGKITIQYELKVDFLKEILNSIQTKVSVKKFDVVFTGGGALVLKDVIDSIEGVVIHNEPIFGNVLGAEIICKELIK